MQLAPVRLATNGTLLNFAQFLKAIGGFNTVANLLARHMCYDSNGAAIPFKHYTSNVCKNVLIKIEGTSFAKLYLTSVTYPTGIGVTDCMFLTVTTGSRTKSLKLYKTPHYYTECVYLVQCTIHAVKQTCNSPGESRQMLEEAINYKLSTMQSHQPVICPRHCP